MALGVAFKPCVVQISEDAFRFACVNPEFTVCYLPVMFAGGVPTSLEKITEEQLEAFLPFMIQCTWNHPDNVGYGRASAEYHRYRNVFSGPKPSWWFKDLPFQHPLRISGMWRNVSGKFAVLKSLVCRCYTYYNCEYMLRVCAELAELPPEKLLYENHDNEHMLSMFTEQRFLMKFWNENMFYDCQSSDVFELTSDSDDEAAKNIDYFDELTDDQNEDCLVNYNSGDSEEKEDDDDDVEDNDVPFQSDVNSIEFADIKTSSQRDHIMESNSSRSEASTSNINLRRRKDNNAENVLNVSKKTSLSKRIRPIMQRLSNKHTQLEGGYNTALSSKNDEKSTSSLRCSVLSDAKSSDSSSTNYLNKDRIVESNSSRSEPSTCKINIKRKKNNNEETLLKVPKNIRQSKRIRPVMHHLCNRHTELEDGYNTALSSKNDEKSTSSLRYSVLSDAKSSDSSITNYLDKDRIVESNSSRSEPSTSNINLRKRKHNNEENLLTVSKKNSQSKPIRPVMQRLSNKHTELEDSYTALSSKNDETSISSLQYSVPSDAKSSDSSITNYLNKDDYLAEIFELTAKKKNLVSIKSNIQPVRQHSKRDGSTRDRTRKVLAKRTQLQIFQNVPFSSDLGQAYLRRVRNFILTDCHIDKIERHVNSDNHLSSLRSSDVGISTLTTNDVNNSILNLYDPSTSFVCTSTGYEEHNPLTSVQCHSRFYKFLNCRRCKKNLHEDMQKCDCLSGSAALNFRSCYVKLDALSKETLDSLTNRKYTLVNEKTSRANASRNSDVSCMTKHAIEIIDLTNEESDDERKRDCMNDILKFVVKSPKKFFQETSSNHIYYSEKNMSLSKEGGSDFNKLMLIKSFQSSKKDSSKSSNHHFMHSTKDNGNNSKGNTSSLSSGSMGGNNIDAFHYKESSNSLKEGTDKIVLKRSIQSSKKGFSESFSNQFLSSELPNFNLNVNSVEFYTFGGNNSQSNVNRAAHRGFLEQFVGTQLCDDNKKIRRKKLSAVTQVARSERILSEPAFNSRLLSRNAQNKESKERALILHSIDSSSSNSMVNHSLNSDHILFQNIWVDDSANSNFRQHINPYLSGSSPNGNLEI